MHQTKKQLPLELICGILCIVATLFELTTITEYFYVKEYVPFFYGITWFLCPTTNLVAGILLAVAIIRVKKPVLYIAALFIRCASDLLFCIVLIFCFSAGFFSIAAILFSLLGYAALAFFTVAKVTDRLPQFKDLAKKLWFLPIIFIALNDLFHIFSYFTFLRFLSFVAEIGMVCLYALLMLTDKPAPNAPAAEGKASVSAAPANTRTTVSDENYISMGVHVLLLLLTCGIWLYVWIYRVTRYLNCVEGEDERNPVNQLLLCMFVPFYFIYWTYKSAQRIDKLAQSKGIASDLATLCLILAIFVGIVPPILMQDKINAVLTGSGASAVPAPAAPVAAPVAPVVDTVEELKRYKELLDMGILTQEEFDAKKAQLLNL